MSSLPFRFLLPSPTLRPMHFTALLEAGAAERRSHRGRGKSVWPQSCSQRHEALVRLSKASSGVPNRCGTPNWCRVPFWPPEATILPAQRAKVAAACGQREGPFAPRAGALSSLHPPQAHSQHPPHTSMHAGTQAKLPPPPLAGTWKKMGSPRGQEGLLWAAAKLPWGQVGPQRGDQAPPALCKFTAPL